ncbi:hypothetical protein BGX27_000977 [Mortierella sp. AM989]|nr:hypothetical protein BGX27_000977 [Mortierella sp. AM989]
MDLVVIESDDITKNAHNEYCLIHPVTMLDLRVPILGVISVQGVSLRGTSKVFIRCLSCESIPPNTTRLPSWMSYQDIGGTSTVRVEGIPFNESLDIIETLVVAPLPISSDIYEISNWVRSTNATNASIIRRGTNDRTWVERSIKQKIEGQVASVGSAIHTRVKAQPQLFKVLDIKFHMSTDSSIGVIDENTVLKIEYEPPQKQTIPTEFGGMDILVQDICKNIDKEVMESNQVRELSYIRTVFDTALQSAPSAVILQDLDTLAKDRGIDTMLQSSALSTICNEMNRVRQSNNVFIFAVSSNRAKLPEVFLNQDFFQHEFQIPIPLKAQRQMMLDAITSSLKKTIDIKEDSTTLNSMMSKVAQMTSGYVAKDLRNLCRSSLLHSLRQGHQVDEALSITSKRNNPGQGYTQEKEIACNFNFPAWKDFSYAIDLSRPSQQIEFESTIRSSSQNIFGGYSNLRKRVYQTIHWPLTNPETFKRMGVKPPMGLLLYGPSGCGKTLLVQSIASESNMNFIPIKGPEIFSKYLGETEATLRRLFTMARQIAPCILFFDEMDSIGAKRGWGGDADSQGSNGLNERVLSTLLNELDGVEERTGVFVVGCTNQPQTIDDALLRPGRLDQLIYVGYPALEDRINIIATIGSQIPLPTDAETIASLARMTIGFSPADLSALLREAAVLTLRRDISSKVVKMNDIEQVILEMKPSVQSRIGKDTYNNSIGSDVIIPEQYRRFQQDR